MHNIFLNFDLALIQQKLQAQNKLIACLCANWCDTCVAWQAPFKQLVVDSVQADEKNCFIWIDIDEHAELVANFDLETLPVLLVQDSSGIYFCGAIEPRLSTVKRLLEDDNIKPLLDPGLYQFLIEGV